MKKNRVKLLLIYTFALVCLLPFVVMLYHSFVDYQGVFTIQQYVKALFLTEDFFRGYWNSLFYTGLIIAFNVPLSLLSAYGFSRFQFKGNRFLFWLYIVLMLMPFQATIVPQYLTLKAFKLINHPMAVILPNIFATFGTVLMAQYMRGLGKELFDAGKIDGFSHFHLFIRIVTPLCKSLIFALTVLSFINYWSMIEQPLVFISDAADMPLSVTLNASGQFQGISYAIGVVFSILPLLLYQLTYQDLIFGISATGGNRNAFNQASNGRRGKKHITCWIVGFMIFMGICTVITQKIADVQEITVEVHPPISKDLKSDYFDINSPSLGYYTYVIPNTALVKQGYETYVFVVEEERSKTKRMRLMKLRVEIAQSNQVESAISGSISKEHHIVVLSDSPLREGQFVRIYQKEHAPQIKKGIQERVEFLGDEALAELYAAVKSQEQSGEKHFVMEWHEEYPIKRMVIQSNQSASDPFFAEHFLASLHLPNGIDRSQVIVEDYTNLGTVLDDMKRFKGLVLYSLCLILCLYGLFQFIILQILWFKQQLSLYYLGEIIKEQMYTTFEKITLLAIGLALSFIFYMKLMGFRFYTTVSDIYKFNLVKRSMTDDLESLSDYGQWCFELLEKERTMLLIFIMVSLAVFVGIIVTINIFSKRKRLKYGESYLS